MLSIYWRIVSWIFLTAATMWFTPSLISARDDILPIIGVLWLFGGYVPLSYWLMKGQYDATVEYLNESNDGK